MARRSRQNPEVKDFILRNVSEHPRDISALATEKFGLSRQAINRYIQKLINEGFLSATGKTSARRYKLKNYVDEINNIPITPFVTEDEVWRDRILPLIKDVPENVVDICQYGFTEIFNNVIDHSESDNCLFRYIQNYCEIEISVEDYGIGIFQKIQNDFGLIDARSALLELSKGRLTSDKRSHTGEGVFFASRMVDSFSISSDDLFYCRKKTSENKNFEWLIESGDLKGEEKITGTLVIMTISPNAKQTMRGTFDEFQGDSLWFRKTHVPIKLGRYPNEQLISRSQAKRILARFDQFKEVLLDFEGIDTVGRAFIDEIFRVFKQQHPGTEIRWIYATPEIDQMIMNIVVDDGNQPEFRFED